MRSKRLQKNKGYREEISCPLCHTPLLYEYCNNCCMKLGEIEDYLKKHKSEQNFTIGRVVNARSNTRSKDR